MSAGAGERGFSLLQLTNILIRNRYLVLLLPVLVATVAVVLTMRQPRTYQAHASFVPNGVNEAQGGQLNSLAAQLGINLTASQPGQSPDFYGELLLTRDILRDAVQSEYEVVIDGRREKGTLVKFFGLDAAPADSVPGQASPVDVAIGILRQSVQTDVAPVTGIVRVQVTTDHPALAEAIAARLIFLTEDFDLNKRRTQASARRQFSEERMREAQAALRRAENALEGYVSRNRLFQSSATQMLEQTKLRQEAELRQQVYVSLAQAYEQARIDEVRNTPVITVIESPQGTAEEQARGTIFQGIFGLLVGLILAVLLAFAREQVRTARASGDQEFQEFESLRRAAFRDLRSLVPGMGRKAGPSNGSRGAP